METEIIKSLNKEYSSIREVPNKGICGVKRMVFTIGLCYDLTEDGYYGRYCYSNLADAIVALNEWTGIGDPPGDWIKHKGPIQYSNPNIKKDSK